MQIEAHRERSRAKRAAHGLEQYEIRLQTLRPDQRTVQREIQGVRIRGAHARNCTHPAFDLLVEPREPRILLVAHRSWFDSKNKYVVLVESGVHICQVDQRAEK